MIGEILCGICAALIGWFGLAVICACREPRKSHLHLLVEAPLTPGAQCNSQPSAHSGTGKRPGFSHSTTTKTTKPN